MAEHPVFWPAADSPYDRGKADHAAGLGTHTNPFEPGTRAATAWHNGWCIANAERAEQDQWQRVNPSGDRKP